MPPGHSARTQIGWSGVTVPGLLPQQATQDADPTGESITGPTSYGFNAFIAGGQSFFSGTATARSTPVEFGPPGIGTGTTLAASSSVNVINSRVAGSTYFAQSTSFFNETFTIQPITGTPAFIDLNFTIAGTMTRSAASSNLVSRVTVSAITNNGPSTTLYSDALGQAPTLNGTQLAPANPNETSRTITNQVITYRLFVDQNASPISVALALNAFTSFGTGATIGTGGQASSSFSSGLQLQSIAVRDAQGNLILPGRYDITGSSGANYSYLFAPTPGAAALLALSGLYATRRRR
ncbi:MAG: hypothetical protein IBJ18_13695 [Phycisphaerales bacterium]|nr:hypothetical protein [Phycisphaerales bacterium]